MCDRQKKYVSELELYCCSICGELVCRWCLQNLGDFKKKICPDCKEKQKKMF